MADRVCAQLPARIAKRGKGLVLGIVDQNIAVSQKQDFGLAVIAPLIPTGRPKPPTELECDGGLPGPGTEV